MGSVLFLERHLTSRQYAVVRLRYAEDMSKSEIAVALDIHVSRVGQLFLAARKNLGKHGITLPAPKQSRFRTSAASQIGHRDAPMNLATL